MQFADFITCGFDQIVNFAAKCRYRWNAPVPIVVRAPSGGGIHGGPFHSQNPEMWFVRTPGLKVVRPATAYDAKGLIKSAIRDNDPVIFFEHKALYRRIKEDLPAGEYTVPIGKAKVVREGTDLTIVTYGAMVWMALEAADKLAEEGASVEVVDLRTLLPLDRETVCASVKKTSKVLLLHEDTRTGGMAGELAASITRERVRIPGRAHRAGHRARYPRALIARRWKTPSCPMPKKSSRRLAGCFAIELLLAAGLLAADPDYRAGTATAGKVKALALEDRRRPPRRVRNRRVSHIASGFRFHRRPSAESVRRGARRLVAPLGRARRSHTRRCRDGDRRGTGRARPGRGAVERRSGLHHRARRPLPRHAGGQWRGSVRLCGGGEPVRAPIRAAFQMVDPAHGLQPRGEPVRRVRCKPSRWGSSLWCWPWRASGTTPTCRPPSARCWRGWGANSVRDVA